MAQTVRLHPLIRDRLKGLPVVLEREFGVSARQEDIVAALVHGTPIGELVGMLAVFKRYTANRAAGTVPPAYQEPPPMA